MFTRHSSDGTAVQEHLVSFYKLLLVSFVSVLYWCYHVPLLVLSISMWDVFFYNENTVV